ncbi:MAG TPA: hypothetical protein VJO34_12255 [Methylomirabilota bacterium]|nr:hypothetical protein [Methylomirabilota bacterium]
MTEHLHTGSITRNLPWLVEMMPSLFCEISPELAGEKLALAAFRERGKKEEQPWERIRSGARADDGGRR